MSAAKRPRLFSFGAGAAHLRQKNLLQLLEPFEGCRQPSLEHRLGVHRLDVHPQPLLNFFEQLVLQRLHLRQPEKLPYLLRRAIDVQLDLHRDLTSFGLERYHAKAWGGRTISCNLPAMAVDIPFRREFSFEYGRLELVAPGVRRIVARNPSPFTFRGTGTYVVGHGEVAVIDPGPDLAEHVAALLAGRSSERVTHILITHTHRDHSPAARALQRATGAPTYGFGPHASGKRGDPAVEEGGGWGFAPDKTLRGGDPI